MSTLWDEVVASSSSRTAIGQGGVDGGPCRPPQQEARIVGQPSCSPQRRPPRTPAPPELPPEAGHRSSSRPYRGSRSTPRPISSPPRTPPPSTSRHSRPGAAAPCAGPSRPSPAASQAAPSALTPSPGDFSIYDLGTAEAYYALLQQVKGRSSSRSLHPVHAAGRVDAVGRGLVSVAGARSTFRGCGSSYPR